MQKNFVNDCSSELGKGSLTERIAALEENIRRKEAVINVNEQNIKLIMEQRSMVRCKPLDYVTKRKFLSHYDARIRQKRSHCAYVADDINRSRAELEKLKAHLPVA
jgi:uncharacterized small protein (DUF1192 family)